MKIRCPHCDEEVRLYTTGQAAKILERPLRNVQWAAKKHKIGGRLGRDWVLTEHDLKLLESLPGPGRPKRKVRRPFKEGDEVRFRGYQKPPPEMLPQLAPGTLGQVRRLLDPRENDHWVCVAFPLPLVDLQGRRWKSHPRSEASHLTYNFMPEELELA